MFVIDRSLYLSPEVVGEPGPKGPLKEVDPFSLEALVAWLEKQDPAQGYCFTNWKSCLWGRYTKAHGGTTDYRYYTIGAAKLSTGAELPGSWQGNVAIKYPHTFGAALSRARKLLAEREK